MCGAPRDQGAVGKARVLERIPHDQGLGLENRVRAEGHVPRRLLLIQAHLGLEPLPGLVHQGDHRDGHLAQISRQRREVVVGLFGSGIQDVVFPQGRQPLCFVVRYRGFHLGVMLLPELGDRDKHGQAAGGMQRQTRASQSAGGEQAIPCASATALCVILPSITLRPLTSAGCFWQASASPWSASISR